MKKYHLSHHDVRDLAYRVASAASNLIPPRGPGQQLLAYPIPRGGVPAAYAMASVSGAIGIASSPAEADFFVDDIIDSGATMQEWSDRYPGKPFFALVDKTDKVSSFADAWVVFPWESEDRSEDNTIVGTLTNRLKLTSTPFHANDNIHTIFASEQEKIDLQAEVANRVEHLLRGLLIDVDNDHNTEGTAKRVAKMYLQEVFKGRYQPPPSVTDFPNAKQLDEMYMSGPITIRSACSHHLVPIVGRAWIGIVPGDRVIGLSKFNRIVEWVASRPQIQEELVMQVADFIEEQIAPKGLAVVIEATHLCMTWRGVREPMSAKMTTSVMRGVLRDDEKARAEFMALVAKS